MEQDELGICHALRLHGRVRHIELSLLPSILQKVVMLMDQHFPTLEHLSLSFAANNTVPLTLPKAFLAPNLRHLALPTFNLTRLVQVFTSTPSTISIVTLELSEIQTSAYFRLRHLVTHLPSLPHLARLSIEFSIAERKLFSNQVVPQGVPVTLPSLTDLQFSGVCFYLESLVAQIRAPLLEKLWITLFGQIPLALPHLSYLINITEAFKFSNAKIGFDCNQVYLTMSHPCSLRRGFFFLGVSYYLLDWQIDEAAGICHALTPALSGIEKLTLLYSSYRSVPTKLPHGGANSATWHYLLRSFIGVKSLHIAHVLLERLSLALQVDEVGSDPGFLPNLQSITSTRGNPSLFASFIDTRQVVGRPVQFVCRLS